MAKTKVIIAHSWIDVSLNIQTKNVAYKLSEQAEVWFFTQARVGRPVLKVNEHLTVMEWPSKRPTKLKDLFFCIRQIRAIKPDAVMVHFGATKVMMLASWLMGVKKRIAWYHTLSGQTRLESGSFIKVQINLIVRTLTYKLATHLVVQNDFSAQDAVANHQVDRKKIVQIENGMLDVPMAEKKNFNYDKKVLWFLYLGRLAHSKGCDFIVRTFAKLIKKHGNIMLQLVGYGDAKDELIRLIKELGVEENILIPGPAPEYKDVFGYLQSAYAMVVPSRIDNFPTVIIEAFASGLPVAASAVGGIPDMVEDNTNGFLCKVEDTFDWMEKLEMLIKDVDKRNAMAVSARKSFEQRFEMGRHVQKVTKLVYENSTAR